MASGDIVAVIGEVAPPDATAAGETVIGGGATPGEQASVFAFDDTTIEYLDFVCRLYGYDGGGLTIRLGYSAAAASGTVTWGAAVRAIPDDAEDFDTTAHSYDFNDASADTVPSAVGELAYVTIAFTSGVDMDSLADGESFILRIRRNTADSLSGDAYLWPQTVIVTET